MLQVLTAQIIADERERAIHRRLKEDAVRREARLASAVGPASPVGRHGAQTHPDGRRCGACPPAAAGAC